MENENNEISLDIAVVPAVLDINFDEIKSELSVKMDEYKNIIVDENTLKGCKNASRELSTLRKDLDDARKKKKKEAEAPIKQFEAKCKELDLLILDAKKTLDDSISVYDNKVRDAHENMAVAYIAEAVADSGLYSPFSEMVHVKDEYRNLSISYAAIKRDIDAQILSAKASQEKQESDISAVHAVVDNENENLNVKLLPDMFVDMLLEGKPVSSVIDIIHVQGNNIRNQEMGFSKKKTDASDKENKTEHCTNSTVSGKKSDAIEIPDELENEQIDTHKRTFSNSIYQVVIETTDSYEKISEFLNFARSNDVNYRIISQEKINS